MSGRFGEITRFLNRLGCRLTGHPLLHVTVGTDRKDRVVATAVVKYCSCLKRVEITGWGTRRRHA